MATHLPVRELDLEIPIGFRNQNKSGILPAIAPEFSSRNIFFLDCGISCLGEPCLL